MRNPYGGRMMSAAGESERAAQSEHSSQEG